MCIQVSARSFETFFHKVSLQKLSNMFLLLVLCAVVLANAEDCIQRREEANGRGLVGTYVPQCNADGTWQAKQCHGSTGYCWCVVEETGDKLLGTEARFKPTTSDCKSKCVLQRHQALALIKKHLLGVMTPSCDADGRFSKLQCHGHLNMCWCADQELGTPIKGSHKNMADGVKPEC